MNYIGIPFSSQVSDMGRTFYNMLKSRGPNDGLSFITDALAPGYTIMAVGLDHFINNDPQIDLKTAALLPVLLRLIEARETQLPIAGLSENSVTHPRRKPLSKAPLHAL